MLDSRPAISVFNSSQELFCSNSNQQTTTSHLYNTSLWCDDMSRHNHNAVFNGTTTAKAAAAVTDHVGTARDDDNDDEIAVVAKKKNINNNNINKNQEQEEDHQKEEEEYQEEEEEKEPIFKKPRRCSRLRNNRRKSKKASSAAAHFVVFLNCKNDSGDAWLGLIDLFFIEKQENNNTSRSSSNNSLNFPLLYRLEHRPSGDAVMTSGGGNGPQRQYGFGEQKERILLFRIDRPGAIAKIIYSSSSSSSSTSSTVSTTPLLPAAAAASSVQQQHLIYHLAKIHVLNVHESIRGQYDLGSLLLTQALTLLQRRYYYSSNTNTTTTGIMYCQLDAKEDISKHNKLIHFYQNLGFTIKPHVKIQYIHNTDSDGGSGNSCETSFRKIPMERTIIIKNNTKKISHDDNSNSFDNCNIGSSSSSLLLNVNDGNNNQEQQRFFLPISFVCGICNCTVDASTTVQNRHDDSSHGNNNIIDGDHHGGTHAAANATTDTAPKQQQQQQQQRDYWLVIENDQGRVEFQTTKGHLLRVFVVPPNTATTTAAAGTTTTDDDDDDDIILHTNHNDDDKQQEHQLQQQQQDCYCEFQLLRVQQDNINDDDDDRLRKHQQQQKRKSDLWLLQACATTSVGSNTTTTTRPKKLFLTLHHHDKNHHSFQCCTTPTFWHKTTAPINNNNNNQNHSGKNHRHHSSSSMNTKNHMHNITCNLVCTTDTPLRRQHYRNQWRIQNSCDHVKSMHSRYMKFEKTKMTLSHALLILAKTISAPSFCVHQHHVVVNDDDDVDVDDSSTTTRQQQQEQRRDSDDDTSSNSLCTRCFANAQAFRHAGHPDWVQLLALLFSLGSIVKCFGGDDDDDCGDYDWTIPCQTWVVGCVPPRSSAIFGEFHQDDDKSSRCHTSTSSSLDHQQVEIGGMYRLHCGLDAVVLPWTGPEYMYHMLQYNGICVPDEGMKMLRYASLVDWHTGNEYQHLTNQEDVDLQSFVAEFSHIIMFYQDASAATAIDDVPSHKECDNLWETHYSDIAKKYNVGSLLCW